MKSRNGLRICPAMVLLLVMAPVVGGAEPRVKVHKDKITVSAPDTGGMVLVVGEAGAIESTSSPRVHLENLSTKERIEVETDVDGSFAASIAAGAGEKVRVWARITEGKRSYGTFTVPEGLSEAADETSERQQIKQGKRLAGRAEGKNLAVVVMVVDTGTGEVLASERIAGAPKQNIRDDRQFADTARRIVDMSIAAAKGQLRPGVVRESELTFGRETQKEKIKKEIKALVDKEIQPLIDGKKSVGAVVGIIKGDDSYVFSYGKKALYLEEAPNGDAVYEIGSITKVFTTALLAKMVREGKVDPEDAVQKYLPETVRMPVYKHDDKERQITLADLATHTSGLGRLPSNIVPMDPANPYVNYPKEKLYEFLGGYELKREPGSKYEYSNLGVGLLGHVLALKAGEGYEELLREEICEPLGMNDTRITLTEQMRERLAVPYSSMGIGILRMYVPSSNWDFKVLAGCGALRSTVNDMLKFTRANLGQTETDLQKVLAATHTEHHKIDEHLRIGWGWHILRLDSNEDAIIWHNGGTGGYRSIVAFIKPKQLGVVILSNSDSSVDGAGIGILLKLKE